ncbi:MAG: TatD family hydrolase [Victivallaceae bacterium]|nr:TatD family hydrolase [Victivallaceae bacterium]
MTLFDTHFHYSGELPVTEYRAKIDAAIKENTLFTLAVGGSPAESSRALEYARSFADSWCAVGIHPHEAQKYRQSGDDLSIFRNEKKVVAIGELGLDYFYDFSCRELQKEVFAEYLALALDWDKPAIVHLRDRENCENAYLDALELLHPFAARGGRFEIHCYTGGNALLPQFAALGAYFGVTGMVTFKNSENIRKQLPLIPPDKLLLETDSPYLAPVPLRGSENHPGNLPLVAAKTAEVLQKDVEEIARLTTDNAMTFFRLK